MVHYLYSLQSIAIGNINFEDLTPKTKVDGKVILLVVQCVKGLLPR